MGGRGGNDPKGMTLYDAGGLLRAACRGRCCGVGGDRVRAQTWAADVSSLKLRREVQAGNRLGVFGV